MDCHEKYTSGGTSDSLQGDSHVQLGISTWGYCQANLDEFEPLRKRIPPWASPDTSDHFFRYADEQTILATWAVDAALRKAGLQARQTSDWGIIAAPEFLGRQQLALYIDRFARNGAPRVSPNSIVQHSLHSVSGALSILLASRGPNLGAGGGHRALEEGLLAGLTLFDSSAVPGCWLIATKWDPLPLPDVHGDGSSSATCYAVALGLNSNADPCDGRLVLNGPVVGAQARLGVLSVPRLLACLEQSDRRGIQQAATWRLSWGGAVTLELNRSAGALRRAA